VLDYTCGWQAAEGTSRLLAPHTSGLRQPTLVAPQTTFPTQTHTVNDHSWTLLALRPVILGSPILGNVCQYLYLPTGTYGKTSSFRNINIHSRLKLPVPFISGLRVGASSTARRLVLTETWIAFSGHRGLKPMRVSFVFFKYTSSEDQVNPFLLQIPSFFLGRNLKPCLCCKKHPNHRNLGQ
jgi:hypothetical protein